MTQQPLFSVLIANYNNGKYVQEAIDSVTSQTYPNWEIIIVDDGSTDKSRKILSRNTATENIHIHYNKENKGCGYTKRRCVELAKGELCCFLDADDELLPDALESHVKAHNEHPKHSCVLSRYYKCSEDMLILEESHLLSLPANTTYLEYNHYRPEVLASFKKKHYDLTVGINADILAAVDQDLYFKLEEIGPICVLDKFTYKYRSTNNQISQGSNWSKALYWNLKVQLDACRRRNIPPHTIYGEGIYNALPVLLEELNNSKNELQRTRKSKAYRLGKFLLHPLNCFKKQC